MTEPGGKIVSYSYDNAMRRTGMIDYNGGVQSDAFDAAGRQAKLNMASKGFASLEFSSNTSRVPVFSSRKWAHRPRITINGPERRSKT